MSNVSTVHDLKPFKAGDKPLTGQRLAKICYKKTKEQPNPLPSVAVSVPFIATEDITSNIRPLLPYICNMLEGTQDKIIRSLYEGRGGKLEIVQDADISVQACIAYLAAESEGDRLTNAAIEAWFDSALSENLTAYIADKLGFRDDLNEDQLGTVLKHVKIYREVLSALAGGKTRLGDKQIKGCKTALTLSADDSDPMVVRLQNRIKSMEGKQTEELLDL